MLETEFKELCQRLNAILLPGKENPHLEQVQSELLEFFQEKEKYLRYHCICLVFISNDLSGNYYKMFHRVPDLATNWLVNVII